MDFRYSRNRSILSDADQILLDKSKVTVVGLGGLGGGVVESLARIGVGHMTLVDPDRFDVTNLNRQLLSTEDLIGEFKTDAAAERIRRINRTVRINTVRQRLNAGNAADILSGSDVVVDCLDSVRSRFDLQLGARKLAIPLVSGAIAGSLGQVTTIFPEDAGFETIYGDPDQIDGAGAETVLGNLSYTALCIAAIQSSEVVKLLIQRGETLRGRLLVMDLMSMTVDLFDLT